MEAVETRVAVIAIIVREGTQVAALNDLLHQYGPYIVGRMGVPYREKGVNIISVAMDAPGDVISALSGKLGRLEGVTAKTVYAPAHIRIAASHIVFLYPTQVYHVCCSERRTAATASMSTCPGSAMLAP